MAKKFPVHDAHDLKLVHLEPGEEPFSLKAAWSDEFQAVVDLSSLLKKKHFTPLQDPALFSQATVADWGWTVRWPNGIEWGADNLRMLADQQFFEVWIAHHNFTSIGKRILSTAT